MLALPSAAGAATFSARVVRASTGALTVRLAGGRIVRYIGARAGGAPARPPLLAHAAREVSANLTFVLRSLEPGVVVLVTARPGSRAGAVITLPGPGAPEQQARGVVGDVEPDALTLELPGHVELRIHGGAHAGLRPCQTVAVSYHQDAGLLVADSIRAAGPQARVVCPARDASGTVTAVSSGGLTISTRGGPSLTFRGARGATSGFAVGDVVDVAYRRGDLGALQIRHVEYVRRIAQGTVRASGDGEVAITDSASGRSLRFATSATPAAGDHVVIVYHRSAHGLVADVLYAVAGSR